MLDKNSDNDDRINTSNVRIVYLSVSITKFRVLFDTKIFIKIERNKVTRLVLLWKVESQLIAAQLNFFLFKIYISLIIFYFVGNKRDGIN